MCNKAEKKDIQHIIDYHPDLICQYNQDNRLLFVNITFCNFFGKSKAELIGQSFLDNIHPDDHQKLLSHIDALDENKSRASITLHIDNSQGEKRLYQFNDFYRINPETNQGEILSSGRDITELINTEIELQKRIDFDQLITNLSINFINAPPSDIDNHINEVLAEIGKLIEVDRSYVFTIDQKNNTISNTHEWSREDVEPQIHKLQSLSCESLQWWMEHLNNFETIRITNVNNMPPEAKTEKEIFQNQDIKSLLNVPLVSAGRLLGFLGFDSVKQLRNWTDEEETILRIIGGIIGSAILQKRNQQELKQRQQYLEKLNELTVATLDINNIDEMLNAVAKKIGTIINADNCAVTLWDEEQKNISVFTSNGVPAATLNNLILSSGEPSMSTSAINAGKTLIAEDAQHSPLTSATVAKELNIKSLLGVPMILDRVIIGTVIFSYIEQHHFTDEEITLAEQAASQVAQSLGKIQLIEHAKRNERAARLLHKAGTIVASTLKPGVAIERILDQLEEVVPFDSASVQILKDDYLEIRAGKGWPSGFNPVGMRLKIPGENPNTVVIQSKKPFVLNDAPEDYLIFSDFHELNIRSWLGVPLIVHDKVIGMLTLDHHQPEFYDDEYLIELAAAFADQVAIALENARLYAEEHRRVTELDALRATTADITRELGLENLIRSILERATELLNATGGELGLLDDENQSIRILVSHNMGSDNTADVIQTGEGLMGYVLQTKQIEMIENYQDWEGRLKIYEDNPIYAAIAAPLMIGNRTLGVIGVMNSDRRRTFSASDKDLMRLFAQQAAIAVENAKLFREKERQARVDITTGIYNRRGLLELGKRELDRAHRYERPLAALMVDVDRFKRVNDTHGHPIGDLVLKELAQIMQNNIRTIDVLGRYGGEEFVILLPETTPESAFEIAERLREIVADHTFTPDSLEIKLTISIGLAFSTGEKNGLDNLIKRADDAMYESKGAGRNRTSIYKFS